MKRAIGLITGGAGGADNAQDPSRTIASERALNGAIVATDISAAVRARLAGFLIPPHVFAEIGGVSVSIQSSPIMGGVADETHSEWTLRLCGVTDATCTVTWCARRRWRLGRVVSEHHYDHRRAGEPYV